jgi:peptide/nickel transport system substrate-binding protein
MTGMLPTCKRIRPLIERLLASFILVLLASGCGPAEKGTRDEPAGATTPADGDLLIAGITSDIDGLNPVTSATVVASDIHEHIFWPLLRSNPDFLTFRPGLADSWEFSPDSLSITFRLNPGAAWHDGLPLRAEDVVWSMGICKDERVAWSAIRWLDDIKHVEALDSLTLRVDFSRRYPYQLMDAVVCRPMPKHLLQDIDPADLRNAPFNAQPVGSGPFKFKSWTPQQSVEVVANESFFKGRPHLNGIVFRVIPDWTTLITQLRNGDLDFANNIQPAFYEELKTDPDLKIYAFPGRRYVYVGWNLRDPLFAGRNVRRALSLAIDTRTIIDALVHGQGEPLGGPILKILWAYDPDVKPPAHDLREARRLMAEAGWSDTNGDGILDKDGKPFRFELVTNSDNTLRMDIAVMIQSQLKPLGVDVKPRGMEFIVLTENLQKKNFQAVIAGWVSAVKVDLTTFWHTKSIEDKFNFISYSNPRVDSIMDTAVQEFDMEKARPLWSEAQQIIAADAGYTFLFHQYDINALDKRFRNVEMNSYGWGYNLEEWYVPENEQKY